MKFFFALCCFLTTAMILPGLAAGEWFTDFEKAKAESLKTNRPIYILFTNSDAAADRGLDRAIFSQRKFKEYADKNLVLMKVDFPVAIHLQPRSLSKQNSDLRAEHGITILPTALLLDANGKLYIDFIKADGSTEKHRRKINEIMGFDAPKRYADYLDGFVKKYTPPKPEEKEPEAKPEAKKQEKKPAAKKPDKKPADKQQKTAANAQADEETIIPDENSGTPLIPLDPEGNLEDWLKAGQTEAAGEVKIERKESVEEVKIEAENAAGKVQVEVKETVEKITVEAKASAEEKTDAVKEEAESQDGSAEE